MSDAELVETAANQVETDPAVESRGRSLAQLQRSADFPKLGKEKEQDMNSFFSLSLSTRKWQRSSP